MDIARERILEACERFMVPLARMLLCLGIGSKEFSEVTKKAFVDAATSQYGLRGRPTNTSRVAVLTGLTRKEVRRLKESLSGERKRETKMGPASTILHFWYKDSAFLDDLGKPLELPREGPGPSFQELARRYGGDVPAGALLSELQRTGAVVETKENKFKVTTRYFLPTGASDIFVDAVSFSLENLAHTGSQNVTNTGKQKDNYLERFVWSDRINEEDVEKFRILAKEKSMALLEYLDDWIAANEIPTPTGHRIGLGLYVIDRPSDQAAKDSAPGGETE